MTYWKTLTVAVAMVATPSVAMAQKVHTDTAPDANFSGYKSYFVVQGKNVPPNPLANQQIQTELDKWLTSKGWTKAEQGQGDVAVVYNVSSEKGQNINTFYDGYGGGYGYGWGYGYRGGPSMGSSSTTVTTFTTGTMVVDMFDAKTKKGIWRGVGSDTLSDKPEKNRKKIIKVCEKMFKKDFPPTPKS